MLEYTIIDTVEVTRIVKRYDEFYYKSTERLAMDTMGYKNDLNADRVEIKDRKIFVREEDNGNQD